MPQFAATLARGGLTLNIPVNGPTRSWAMARAAETMPLFGFALRTTSRMPTAMIAATTQATERTWLASESVAEASRAARGCSANDPVSVSRPAERAPVGAGRSSWSRPVAGAAVEVATSSPRSRFPAARGANACGAPACGSRRHSASRSAILTPAEARSSSATARAEGGVRSGWTNGALPSFARGSSTGPCFRSGQHLGLPAGD